MPPPRQVPRPRDTLTPDQLRRRQARLAKLRLFWDDPLNIAIQRRRIIRARGYPPDHVSRSEDVAGYYRAYRARRRAGPSP